MQNSFFYEHLGERAASRVDRAVLVVAFAADQLSVDAISPRQIGTHFHAARLAVPNQTDLARALKRDSRVSCRDGLVRPLRGATAYLRASYPEFAAQGIGDESRNNGGQKDSSIGTVDLSLPFLDSDYLTKLEGALSLYRAVHALENSMRGLVQHVLSKKHGPNWWELVANNPMKKKHADRLQKEQDRKWLPARSDLGPLYSIDWSDLITLMRNDEAAFLPYLGEANFLHRFADMGLLRHVIAHNGFLEDETEATRALLALRDWKKQLGRKA